MRQERRDGPGRFPSRIGDSFHVPTATPADHDAGTGDETPQVEARVIQDASPLRVRRVVQLKAAIEPVAVDEVGAHPSTHGIGALQHCDVHTAAGEMTSGSEPAEPCSYDDDAHNCSG